MAYVPSFESAWSLGAESDLPVADYARRKLVLRRQKIVHVARALGWSFLRVGERLPPGDCLLAGIRLDRLRDLQFLDLLRARPGLWRARAVCLFHVEKPYVLPLPSWPAETPLLAFFEEGKLDEVVQGDAAFRALMAEGP